MKAKHLISIIIIGLNFSSFSIFGADHKPLIYQIDIKKEIGSTTWLYVQNGFKEARGLKADVVILHMNTYGGAVLYADSIRSTILNSSIPVLVFIDNNAASAGALIAIACDSIYMRKGANIGAATVVNESGEKMPDKYQSYMRATIRATAEAHGMDTIVLRNGDTLVKWRRDPRIAEAMVDERIVVPGIIDSTKILTFTADEAVKYGYCEGIADNVDEIITKYLHYPEYTLHEYKPTAFDEIKGFLLNPVFQAILIMLIIGGIYFELQSPGTGFPIVVAAVATVLYFTPLYIDGLAQYWEIIIFVVGLVLIALEIFVIPGFGVTGITGIICVTGGLTLALINNVDFDFSGVSAGEAGTASLKVFSGLVLGTGVILYLSGKIGSKGIFRKLALETSQNVSEGYISVSLDPAKLIGREGIAKTVLRPAGKVMIDDEIYDAVSYPGFIESGTKVKVVRYETGQIYVEAVTVDK
ncbi:MAG: nodulation protein NfeD [Candidatus Azobacteroides sp.]|nr:nodulation protein NfeD [Candidatus Azobacteroides sp.]